MSDRNNESVLESFRYLPVGNVLNFVNNSANRGLEDVFVDSAKFLGHMTYAVVGGAYVIKGAELASRLF